MTENATKAEVPKYFPYCPFCLQKSVEGRQEAYTTGNDVAICNRCGAKWHVYVSAWTEKMQWAELIKVGEEGGENFLGTRHKPEFWREMVLRNLKQRGKPEKEVTEKPIVREVVKEKEVIVKVRCPYCHKLYDETVNTCPHCGASR